MITKKALLVLPVALLLVLGLVPGITLGAEVTHLRMSAPDVKAAVGAEFEMPVRVQGMVAEADGENLVRFYGIIPGLEAGDIELFAIEGGTPAIVVDLVEREAIGAEDGDLVIAWGPAGGFPLGTYAGDDEGQYGHNDGRTTDFLGAISALGIYEVTFVLYDWSNGEQINREDEAATILIADHYAKVSGGIHGQGNQGRGRGKGAPTHAFEGFVIHDSGSGEIIGQIAINYRQLREEVTFTPGESGTFELVDDGIAILAGWTNGEGLIADITLVDRSVHPSRGAIEVSANDDDYDIDFVGLESGNVHVVDLTE